MAKLSQFSGQQKDFDNKTVSEKEIKEKFDTYKDMSSSQLNNQLFQEVSRQKSQGTFDYEGLERMVTSLRGSLSSEQYDNIKRLLESLK